MSAFGAVLTLSTERLAAVNDASLTLAAGRRIEGKLDLVPHDGPLGAREFANPSFFFARFDFHYASKELTYSGWISIRDLWAPAGAQTIPPPKDFREAVGPVDGILDNREPWSYRRPNGALHENELKHTSCHFRVLPVGEALLVECRYYDQNPNIADYVIIYYHRPLEALILLNDTLIYCDSNGEAEDFDLHGAEVMSLESL